MKLSKEQIKEIKELTHYNKLGLNHLDQESIRCEQCLMVKVGD